MSYFQATTCKPHSGLIVDRPIVGLGKTCRLLPVAQCSLRSRALGLRKLEKQIYPRLVIVAASHKRVTPVYASSGKWNPEIDNDVSIFRAPMLDYT
jgi:deoxyinosine 3'endonuclease (endonuclease V)